jgi:hypothetical protein
MFHIVRRTESQNGTAESKSWHMGFIPDLGIIFPVRDNLNLVASFQFHYAREAGDLRDQAYYALSLGFVWGAL